MRGIYLPVHQVTVRLLTFKALCLSYGSSTMVSNNLCFMSSLYVLVLSLRLDSDYFPKDHYPFVYVVVMDFDYCAMGNIELSIQLKFSSEIRLAFLSLYPIMVYKFMYFI
jgi:hypothetical protein